MARFRGTVRGSRGASSRLGSAKSGLVTINNGWNAGIRVVAGVSLEGSDVFYIVQTGGSNASIADLFLGKVERGQWFPAEGGVDIASAS